MKKLFVLLLLVCGITVSVHAQVGIYTGCYFDDFWGEFESDPTIKVKGDFDNILFYHEEDGPWGYFLKLTIDNFTVVPKKQRKKDIKEKNKVVYKYTGTVEYYLPDYGGTPNITIYDLFKQTKKPFLLSKDTQNESIPKVKKIVSRANIRIYAYENYPEFYDMMFDNVGVGFYLVENYFKNSVFNFGK